MHHQQQHQQQHQQHHQQQQFQQQIPVQQTQQVHHQQHQQQPLIQQQHNVPIQQQQGGHSHDHGHNPQQLLGANIAEEKLHIAEHLEVPGLDTAKMTDQELQFHYFKMHDADNNNKLDGCELIKSLIHWHGMATKITKINKSLL